MKAAEIRKAYIDFFVERDHRHLPSASLISDDPTLLTTIAGMVQFKPYFLGLKKPPHTRVTTHQKCLRALDLDEVGPSPRHHTFFEMMGNFSFGDYFKAEIIPWSWEFLTKVLGIDPARLSVSVYLDDDEAAGLWLDGVGVPKERFYRLGEKDNYWPASCPSKGPNGPCGPCSEIFYDFGEDRGCGKPECNITCNCGRYIEVWNLVFMQNERHDGGKLTPLPKKNIDTGLGLERVASVLQGTKTNFETDLFLPMIRRVEKLSGKSYDDTPIPFRVIADHIRGVVFLLGDGAHPSNEGLGYLLRKVLRRAIMAGNTLGIDEPFLSLLVDDLLNSMADVYPEIAENKKNIELTLKREEEQFDRVLMQGEENCRQKIRLIWTVPEDLSPAEIDAFPETASQLSGGIAFYMQDTFGFPKEETKKIAAQYAEELVYPTSYNLGATYIRKNPNNLDVTEYEKAFQKKLEEQKARSRAGSKMDGSVFVGEAPAELTELTVTDGAGTEFLGYDGTQSEGKLLLLLKDGKAVVKAEKGDVVDLVFDRTPFYAEKGGQIGDRGTASKNGAEIEITDTQIHGDKIVLHRGEVKSGAVAKGDSLKLSVDPEARELTKRHHTATHLLHSALRNILGDHVTQAGSYVGPDKLRFDFTHHSKVGRGEARQIERLVNEAILKNFEVQTKISTPDQAKKEGAMALFGEKYGDRVRVVSIGNVSVELCGGTHMDRTGGIGPFRIVSESSAAAGIRRIEALAGEAAIEWIDGRMDLIDKISEAIGVETDRTPQAIATLIEEKKTLQQKMHQLQQKTIAASTGDLVGDLPADGPAIVVRQFADMGMDSLLKMYDEIKQKAKSHRVLLGGAQDGKVSLVCRFSDDQVKEGWDAGKTVKDVAKIVGGGGGGSKQAAQAGGKLPEKLSEAIKLAEELLTSKR